MQELQDAHQAVRQKRRRLPVGTSDYQAAWLLDEDDTGASGSELEVSLSCLSGMPRARTDSLRCCHSLRLPLVNGLRSLRIIKASIVARMQGRAFELMISVKAIP